MSRGGVPGFSSRSGRIGLLLFCGFGLAALAADWIAPFDALAIHYDAAHAVVRMQKPGLTHLLGTNYYGRDIFSQVVVGARVSIGVGLLSAAIIVFVGTNIGLVSGYFGGRTDALLMRITDIAFGIPFFPFAILLVALLRPSIWNIVVTISCLLWRSVARVVRSQVLSLRERAFVRAAQVAGASHLRVMYVHIFPNILPMVLLYVSIGISYAVLAEASLSFLGFGDPNMTSWGSMLYDAYVTGSMSRAWWWTLPPGICITLFVVSVFLMARDWEVIANPRLAA
ncbi:MAG: ABC transporter permease [Rhodobacteraceae bacterium]|nr:ABC transporter permease [Paracoccaceae bacterium]